VEPELDLPLLAVGCAELELLPLAVCPELDEVSA
jgi:hypothetical protein